jgi:NAD(P)H-dependent flavin oxidoreductase YrpB (nitropropane dioxygenase family)
MHHSEFSLSFYEFYASSDFFLPNQAPEILQQRIRKLKSYLNDPKAPFGVDILILKTGEGAKAANIDCNNGRLEEMIDVIIAEGASLFVSALGAPPPHIIEKLHKAGVRVAVITKSYNCSSLLRLSSPIL